ncbi:zf-DHHC-domain-containing protein [Xylona heveae TC161]|uniref:Palmitoyltransferase PFA4 n=1 Tax=Xylona heveae (strain CBS 132557 / TC161) TaxID=1328760 RepID=A0A165JDB9_XYLHT|nr:zf-DHHC-domain-containing protein [Xylona heveae TC161]KZF26086.1 zf-DHHC-domain-containing protein [Xylona heveae TC161]
MELPPLSSLAIPGVSLLIAFLAYSSQILFHYIEPGPLEKDQYVIFNLVVACIWVCYARTCYIDPGKIPKDWPTAVLSKGLSSTVADAKGPNTTNLEPVDMGEVKSSPTGTSDIQTRKGRWCRKCEAPKPPRAHHCKQCKRCIPKMDHHCPWTSNCVSHTTIPHFMRFVFYAVTSMSYLEYFICIRAKWIWDSRDLPSYFGPSILQLSHLLVLFSVNSFTLFVLTILLFRAIWSLGSNTTTIESWEKSRHGILLRRAKALGGYLDGPDGTKIKIKKQEFPYDIGIWKNFKQNMGGTSNILAWFWPFSSTPTLDSGLEFEVNGFEDPSVTWPPPDPDRMPRTPIPSNPQNAFTYKDESGSSLSLEAFKQRQREDLERRESPVYRRARFHKRYDRSGKRKEDRDSPSEDESGEEGWRNRDGDRLADFGVDEAAEFYDEDNIPLAELLKKRKNAQKAS